MSRVGKEIDRQTMAAAKASYDRCSAAEHFFEDFYRNFFDRCPKAKPLFAHTDFERQHNLLRHAFALLLIFPNQPEREPTILARVAERHSRRELGIDPSMYQPFIDALIDTVRQNDPQFTSAVESAWRKTVEKGVAYMQAKY
ncbi:MAG TPA: globin domain-containing protein [Gemmatimonadales bacterium]|nr:globin domain-containing protein [Gemmatimonadales bacterium]